MAAPRAERRLAAVLVADVAGYSRLVERWGFPSETRVAHGVDVCDEIETLCAQIATDYPRAVFFCGDLVFQLPTAITGMLHDRTAEELQRRLHLRGLPLIVVPIRV